MTQTSILMQENIRINEKYKKVFDLVMETYYDEVK